MRSPRHRSYIANQPLTWHTRIERIGRITYRIWASTIPEGGTAVVTWQRMTRTGAERVQRRVHRLQDQRRARLATWAEQDR